MASTTAQQTSTKCLRCGRTLTSAASIARGYGKGCATRIRHAAAELAGFKPEQVDAARLVIEDGAIVPLRGRVFLVVSSDGDAVHRTTATACSCPAGIKNRRCFHRAAVALIAA
jgi:hypothetical protein